MAPRKATLLVFAALAPAHAELQEDGNGAQQAVARVDSLTSSFYVEVNRKGPPPRALGSAGRSRSEQVKSLGKAAVVGVNSAVVAHWIIHPLFRKLADRLSPPESARSSEAAEHAEPALLETLRPSDGDEAVASRSWQLSAVVGLTAVAALCSSKARGRLASRRRGGRSGANAVASAAVSKLAQLVSSGDSDHSTDLEGMPTRTPGTSSNDSSFINAMDDSESDLADNEDAPVTPGPSSSATTPHQLLPEGAKAMPRQTSAPAGSVSHGRRLSTGSWTRQSSSASTQGQGAILPVPKLTPAEETEWNVRQRAAEFERKIDFHRMESENSVYMTDDNEYERSMDLKTDFYRIGTGADQSDWGDN